MPKQIFVELLSKYTSDQSLTEKLWSEIEGNYTNKKRHYHTLSHLDNLFFQLNEARGAIGNWDAILFTLFYHDVIYNSLKSDNEEKVQNWQ